MQNHKDEWAGPPHAGPMEADAVGCVLALFFATTAIALFIWIVALVC